MAAEVYIGNLPDDVTEQIVKNKLKIFGNVSTVSVRKLQADGKPKKGKSIVYKNKKSQLTYQNKI